jgi:putative SOS response-associated peptidase YedK
MYSGLLLVRLDPAGPARHSSPMCGRLAYRRSSAEVAQIFGTRGTLPAYAPLYNVAPSYRLPVIRWHRPSGERRLDLLDWGLVPHWLPVAPTRRPFNARAETVTRNRYFSSAFHHRRAIIAADAYFEWRGPEGHRQPYTVARADGGILALGGIWESHTGTWAGTMRTCAVITTPAPSDLAWLHARAPLVLAPERWAAWLNGTPAEAEALLLPAQHTLCAWPVSDRVNRMVHSDARLLVSDDG